MKKQKVHYAAKILVVIACGIAYFRRTGFVKLVARKSTFNKRKVTCKRCRKSKAFKNE